MTLDEFIKWVFKRWSPKTDIKKLTQASKARFALMVGLISLIAY
jgi:hypothetical protein